jgi:hypothetical protein
MKKIYLPLSLLALFLSANSFGQNIQETLTQQSAIEIKGLVLDSATKAALPYANIYILNSNKGMISNEQGQFSISRAGLKESDTLRFQYIGYASKKIRLSDLDASSKVYLKEEITNLSEALVFGNAPNPASIVKKVLLYKDSNYKRTNYSKNQTFIRERENVDFTDIRLNCKKTSIKGLDKEMFQLLEEKIPKHTTSYTDFLGDIYFAKSKEDSIKRKLNEIRTVSLKEKDIAELKQFENVFENIFKDKEEKEYWKVRSGIFASKIDEDNEQDTVPKKDTLIENRKRLSSYNRGLNYKLRYSLLNDKDQWEFLHKTGRYKYTLIGGTRVNGEEVYIIDFTPKSSGVYHGRMYISIASYALIRADYAYALGKTGRDFHLLGIGYTETQFNGSIYFEKKDETYSLKYFSYKTANSVSIERKVSLLKKKKRLLFDKKLEELKLDILFALDTEESIEYLVLDDKEISKQQYDAFTQVKYMDVIYVDQFDDKLWSGFSIIEPTQQMKEYKKQQVNFKVE